MLKRPGKTMFAVLAIVITFGTGSCRSKAGFDRNDPQAVRRAVVEDLRALGKLGIVVVLVDTKDRVRVVVVDLTAAKTEVLQKRYGPLIDAETARKTAGP